MQKSRRRALPERHDRRGFPQSDGIRNFFAAPAFSRTSWHADRWPDALAPLARRCALLLARLQDRDGECFTALSLV
jgi:hypothetical protein